MALETAYDQLISLLDHNGARYRLIDHAPEGQTELVSALRGHPLSMAAKCMILMAKLGKKEKKFILCVLPGDRRLDLAKVKTLCGATYLSFASPEMAETLGGTTVGTILPFAFNSSLQLIVDPGLKSSEEVFFNAGRLDRSVALNTEDYVAIAKPLFRIVTE